MLIVNLSVVRCLKVLVLSSRRAKYLMKLRCCHFITHWYCLMSVTVFMYGVTHMTHLKHVLVLQNKAVRIIAGVPPRTSADSLYLELDILPVKKIFVHAISIFMYKYLNRMLPELFLDMFTPVSEIHNYDTRQAINKNLFVSFKSTSRGQQSITYIGPHVWNFILSKIDPHCSIGSFKRHIRQLLQHCSVSDLTWWSLTL